MTRWILASCRHVFVAMTAAVNQTDHPSDNALCGPLGVATVHNVYGIVCFGFSAQISTRALADDIIYTVQLNLQEKNEKGDKS